MLSFAVFDYFVSYSRFFLLLLSKWYFGFFLSFWWFCLHLLLSMTSKCWYSIRSFRYCKHTTVHESKERENKKKKTKSKWKGIVIVVLFRYLSSQTLLIFYVFIRIHSYMIFVSFFFCSGVSHLWCLPMCRWYYKRIKYWLIGQKELRMFHRLHQNYINGHDNVLYNLM